MHDGSIYDGAAFRKQLKAKSHFCNKVPSQIFFSIWVFFHNHSRITGLLGKGEGISLTPHDHFHPFHRHLGISRAITAESSPLHISSRRTRTENLWFSSASWDPKFLVFSGSWQLHSVKNSPLNNQKTNSSNSLRNYFIVTFSHILSKSKDTVTINHGHSDFPKFDEMQNVKYQYIHLIFAPTRKRYPPQYMKL